VTTGAAGTSASVTNAGTSSAAVLNFTIPQGADGAGGGGGSVTADQKVRVCEVVFGDPGAASVALADDNDMPFVCSNKTGVNMTITAVECRSSGSQAYIQPIITAGTSTSIVTAAFACNVSNFASGALNGTPIQATGTTLDVNLSSASGSKYVVVRITRTLP
jgi:hypothetical protein